jgi:hypothetical protein
MAVKGSHFFGQFQKLRAEPFQNAAARKTLVSMTTVICAD